MKILEELRSFMLQELADNGFHSKIGNKESLIDAGILDSLSMLAIVSYIAEKYEIYPEDHEMDHENFETIERIVQFIKTKMGN